MIGSFGGSVMRQRVQYSPSSEKQAPDADKQPEEVVWGKTPAGEGKASFLVRYYLLTGFTLSPSARSVPRPYDI